MQNAWFSVKRSKPLFSLSFLHAIKVLGGKTGCFRACKLTGLILNQANSLLHCFYGKILETCRPARQNDLLSTTHLKIKS
jgi:hypothetical protein